MNENIEQAAKKANANRRSRTISQEDMEKFEQLVEEYKNDSSITSIRVYSGEGFVPNAYKWRADISYLQGLRTTSGEFSISGMVTDAKRSYGTGALVTVNGKAYDGRK